MSDVKAGVLHDYDLKANEEPAAKARACVVCGFSPMSFQWSDYHGEAMCRRCGTPYQLKGGSERQEAEGAYPYLNLNEEWVPVVRRYFEETGAWTYLGRMFGGTPPGLRSFVAWVEANDAAPKRPAPTPEEA